MEFLGRHKRLFLAAGILLCAVMMVFTLRPGYKPMLAEKLLVYIAAPLQKAATSTVRRVGGFFAAITEVDRLRAENEDLRERLNLLSIDNQRLRLADDENKKLSALISIDQKYADLPKTGAEIIGKDPNDWYDSFHIDKGTNDGLTKNMAVLGGGGLVGVIREVYPGYSKVISIIDHRFSAAGKNTRTEDIGIVKGDYLLMPQALCRMDYIDARAQIMAGDEIVTSNHSSFFPPGILIGTVLSVEANPDGLTKHAILKPEANVRRVETVLVVTQLFGDENAVDDKPQFLED